MKVYEFGTGRFVGEFESDADLLRFMKDDEWWPNLFQISDHGNVHHYHLDGVKYSCGRMIDGIVSNCHFEGEPEHGDYIIQ